MVDGIVLQRPIKKNKNEVRICISAIPLIHKLKNKKRVPKFDDGFSDTKNC